MVKSFFFIGGEGLGGVCFSICESSTWMIFHFVFLILNVCWQKCENIVLQLQHCLAFYWKTFVSCDRYLVFMVPV